MKERESCDWRQDTGEAGFFKVLLDEWVSREERDRLEGGKGLEKKKKGPVRRMKGGRERKTKYRRREEKMGDWTNERQSLFDAC